MVIVCQADPCLYNACFIWFINLQRIFGLDPLTHILLDFDLINMKSQCSLANTHMHNHNNFISRKDYLHYVKPQLTTSDIHHQFRLTEF